LEPLARVWKNPDGVIFVNYNHSDARFYLSKRAHHPQQTCNHALNIVSTVSGSDAKSACDAHFEHSGSCLVYVEKPVELKDIMKNFEPAKGMQFPVAGVELERFGATPSVFICDKLLLE